MSNTVRYDKNHSNDPSALQGRDPGGRFTEDTMGGNEMEEKKNNFSDISNFFQKSNPGLTYKDKEALNVIDSDELMYWLRQKDFEDDYEDEEDKIEHQRLNDEYAQLFELSPSMKLLSDKYKKVLKEGFATGNIESKRIVIDLIKNKGLRYYKGNDSYLDSTNNRISIVVTPPFETGEVFWHEHWHAIDKNILNLGTAKQEFQQELAEFQKIGDSVSQECENELSKKIQDELFSTFGNVVKPDEVGAKMKDYFASLSGIFSGSLSNPIVQKIGVKLLLDQNEMIKPKNSQHIYDVLKSEGYGPETLIPIKEFITIMADFSKQHDKRSKISYQYSNISDILEGAGFNSLEGWGHGHRYWSRNSDMVRTESIANIGSMLSYQKKSPIRDVTLEFAKKYFPKTLERMRKIMIKGGK